MEMGVFIICLDILTNNQKKIPLCGQCPPSPSHYLWKMQFILSCQSPSTGSPIYACLHAQTINMHMCTWTVEVHGSISRASWCEAGRDASVHLSIALYWQCSLLIKPPPSVRRPTASPADTLSSRCSVGVASCSTASSHFLKILLEVWKDAHELFLFVC